MTMWRKSSYSNTPGGNCVEVGDLGAKRGVRDSKDQSGPILTFDPTDFAAFVRAVQSDG